MTKNNKIATTILLSAILFGVIFTSLNIQSAYAQPALFGLAFPHPNGPATLYTISTSTGIATSVGLVGFDRCSGMDFDASGTLFATCNRSFDGVNVLITINTSTGAGTEIGATGSEAFFSQNNRFGQISDISFRNSDGVLYGYGGPDGPVFTINTATGAVSQVGPFPTFPTESGNALAFSATDTLFYMEIDPPVLNTLNPITGAKTVLGSIGIGCCSGTNHRVNAADFDPNSGVLFGSLNVGGGGAGAPIHLVTITTTGSLVAASIGITVDGLDAIAFQPEPDLDQEILDEVRRIEAKLDGDRESLVSQILSIVQSIQTDIMSILNILDGQEEVSVRDNLFVTDVHLKDGQVMVLLDNAGIGGSSDVEVTWRLDDKKCLLLYTLTDVAAGLTLTPFVDGGALSGNPAHQDLTGVEAIALTTQEKKNCHVNPTLGEYIGISTIGSTP